VNRKAPRIVWLGPDDPPEAFPELDQAFTEPDGLLAAGGDLSAERLLYAYQHGIFPWYDDGQPVLWWSPNPRCVLVPGNFHRAKRLQRFLKSAEYHVSFDSAFDEVIAACAGHRDAQAGTWITDDMMLAYAELHRAGWAHSVEIWRGSTLAGGLYGLSIGRAFFGESMFSRESNASKAAMLALCVELCDRQFEVLDCQVESPHLASLGATLMPRAEFAALLEIACVPAEPLDLSGTVKRPITDYL
jgi:leucyl/phenylalanyl-tRNA--protein transferase